MWNSGDSRSNDFHAHHTATSCSGGRAAAAVYPCFHLTPAATGAMAIFAAADAGVPLGQPAPELISVRLEEGRLRHAEGGRHGEGGLCAAAGAGRDVHAGQGVSPRVIGQSADCARNQDKPDLPPRGGEK